MPNAKTEALRGKKGIACIYLVRHGATPDEKTAMGGWSEEGLGKTGRSEAKSAAPKVGDDIACVYTSDLERAVETAKIISKDLGVPMRKEAKLRSWDIGEFEGEDPATVEPILDKIAQKLPDVPVSDGECFDAYRRRILGEFKRLVAQSKGKEIAVVTHSHALRLMKAWRAKGYPDDCSVDMECYGEKSPPNGAVVKYEI